MQNRYKQLDSLRGLAAIFVFMNHISLVTAAPFLTITVSSIIFLPINILTGKNLYSFINFFFILSGFVLYLLFIKGKSTSYGTFMIRRFFRLYIPYIIAVIVSITECMIFSKKEVIGLSAWFNYSWTEPVTLKSVLNHILMIGNFNTNLYNNVIWSLVQEMRVSMIFPILAPLISRINWKLSVLLCIGLSFISGLNNIFQWEKNLGYHTSFFATFQIISMFIFGCLLAKHVNKIITFYETRSKLQKVLLLLMMIGSFAYHEVLTVIANYMGGYYFGEIMSDYAIGIGTIMLLSISLASGKVQAILTLRPLPFFGNISYSLYLYHLPVLFGLIHIFYNRIPLWMITSLSIPLAICAAWISWKLVERPATKYGKELAEKVDKFFNKRLVKKKEKDLDNVV